MNLQGTFVAGYIGTHGMAHGLDTLIEAAHLLRHHSAASHIRILLLGDGAEKATLQQRAADLSHDNILFVDTVAKDEVPRWWSLLDVSIIHLRRTELFSTVIPSKLFECMGMGIPVLLGVAGESAEIVEREQVGRVFEPENVAQLADLLIEVSQNESLLSHWHSHCVVSARRYDRNALAHDMLQILQSVART